MKLPPSHQLLFWGSFPPASLLTIQKNRCLVVIWINASTTLSRFNDTGQFLPTPYCEKFSSLTFRAHLGLLNFDSYIIIFSFSLVLFITLENISIIPFFCSLYFSQLTWFFSKMKLLVPLPFALLLLYVFSLPTFLQLNFCSYFVKADNIYIPFGTSNHTFCTFCLCCLSG